MKCACELCNCITRAGKDTVRTNASQTRAMKVRPRVTAAIKSAENHTLGIATAPTAQLQIMQYDPSAKPLLVTQTYERDTRSVVTAGSRALAEWPLVTQQHDTCSPT